METLVERPVQVYGYYGDDRDPGTSGIITLSTQTTETLEKVAYDYVGSGNANFSGAASDVKLVTAYEASGTLFVQGGSAEATTADPADETVLYTFSGNALESYHENTCYWIRNSDYKWCCFRYQDYH